MQEALNATEHRTGAISIQTLSATAVSPEAQIAVHQARNLLSRSLSSLRRIDLKATEARVEQHLEQINRHKQQEKDLQAELKQLQAQLTQCQEDYRQLEAGHTALQDQVQEFQRLLKERTSEYKQLRHEHQEEQKNHRSTDRRLRELQHKHEAEQATFETRRAELQEQLKRATEAWGNERANLLQDRRELETALSEQQQHVARLEGEAGAHSCERQEQYDLILRIAQQEEKRLSQGDSVPAHNEFGVLIATLRVQSEIDGLDFVDFARFEQLLGDLMEDPARRDSLLGHTKALQAFNRFQAGTLPYGDVVEAEIQQDTPRDQQIVLFAKQHEEWRHQHRRRLAHVLLQFQSGTFPQQAALAACFEQLGIDPAILTPEAFADLVEHEGTIRQVISQNSFQSIVQPKASAVGTDPAPVPDQEDPTESPFGV